MSTRLEHQQLDAQVRFEVDLAQVGQDPPPPAGGDQRVLQLGEASLQQADNQVGPLGPPAKVGANHPTRR